MPRLADPDFGKDGSSRGMAVASSARQKDLTYRTESLRRRNASPLCQNLLRSIASSAQFAGTDTQAIAECCRHMCVGRKTRRVRDSRQIKVSALHKRPRS